MAFGTSSSVQKCTLGVVDVGSTGSRLHVYLHDCDGDNTQLIKEIWTKKITPDFPSLELKQSAIDAYLEKLFDGAPPEIPVYFYATAGMRLLPKDKQHAYYDAAAHWFGTSSWRLSDAKTITGREEGVFAWLAVNQEQRALPGNKHEEIGVMDMGGASVQIVTSVASSDGKNPDDIIHVNVEHQDITLFVHSFLGLGSTLVSQQFLNNPTCFPEGYVLPDGATGHGDAGRCETAVTRLINNVHAVNATIQPALEFELPKTWYVLGGLSYLLQEEPFRRDEAPATAAWLMQQANHTVCQRGWSDLRLEYPGYTSLSQGCLMASYYHALLSEGYGLRQEEPIHMTLNDVETDWTLGVVLHQH